MCSAFFLLRMVAVAHAVPLFFRNNTFLPRTRDGVAVFSAVTVFNMAVIFHLKSQKENISFRTKALHLYESVIDLFSKVSTRFDLSGAIAVALNNKASLFFLEDEYEDSERELDRLETYMARAERSQSTCAIMEAQDFQEILLNILTLRKPGTALAA